MYVQCTIRCTRLLISVVFTFLLYPLIDYKEKCTLLRDKSSSRMIPAHLVSNCVLYMTSHTSFWSSRCSWTNVSFLLRHTVHVSFQLLSFSNLLIYLGYFYRIFDVLGNTCYLLRVAQLVFITVHIISVSAFLQIMYFTL